MKILRLLSFTLLILGMFLGNTLWAGNFTAAELEGEYAFAYDGYIINLDPNTGQMLLLPTASVGQIVVNDQGQATATAVQNVAGVAILSFATPSSNMATIRLLDNTTGRGITRARVTLNNVEGVISAPNLGLNMVPGDEAVFEFYFVIDGDGSLQMIGTKLLAADGTPLVATVGRGSAKRQP